MERKFLRPSLLLAMLGAVGSMASAARAEGEPSEPRKIQTFFTMLASDKDGAAILNTVNLDESGKQELLRTARAAYGEDLSYQLKRLRGVCARASSIQTLERLADEFTAYKDDTEANQVRIEQQAFAALSEPVRAQLVLRLSFLAVVHESRDQARASILNGSGSAQSMLAAICADTGGIE